MKAYRALIYREKRNHPHPFQNSEGFTLLEMIIVIVIISILALLVAPRLTTFLGGRRGNFIILTSLIARTFDDSFIRGNTNFLIIHLYETDEESEVENEIFSRRNGVSVVTLKKNGTFVDSKNRMLSYQEFSDDFKIEEVLLPSGDRITYGNVLIPFYPKGMADDAIIHILVDDEERWSVRIHKLRKEASIASDYIDFSL
jgi:prepilin-type N-terminal cleavage/methylation domain-containing protein